MKRKTVSRRQVVILRILHLSAVQKLRTTVEWVVESDRNLTGPVCAVSEGIVRACRGSSAACC